MDLSGFEGKLPKDKFRDYKEAFTFYNISGNGLITSERMIFFFDLGAYLGIISKNIILELGKALRSLGFLVSTIEQIELVKSFGKSRMKN